MLKYFFCNIWTSADINQKTCIIMYDLDLWILLNFSWDLYFYSYFPRAPLRRLSWCFDIWSKQIMMEKTFVSQFLNKFVCVSVGRCWAPGESQGRARERRTGGSWHYNQEPRDLRGFYSNGLSNVQAIHQTVDLCLVYFSLNLRGPITL